MLLLLLLLLLITPLFIVAAVACAVAGMVRNVVADAAAGRAETSWIGSDLTSTRRDAGCKMTPPPAEAEVATAPAPAMTDLGCKTEETTDGATRETPAGELEAGGLKARRTPKM